MLSVNNCRARRCQPGSQSGADGYFLFASGCAGEQKVGDVGTGDQQNERYGAQQHEQSAAHVSDYLLLQAD